ncbi:MAG: Txe/YoeB family addiction module toxin [Zoogloeaceae bacterium]|nr:Txe/YoeB family addiction module toxin [Zoogloeaceae bacterium]
MIKYWDDAAWDDYIFWQTHDRKILKRINALIKDIERDSFDGIGKPEALRGNFQGYWSRRIDDTHRIIYRIKDRHLEILQCRTHYGDK